MRKLIARLFAVLALGILVSSGTPVRAQAAGGDHPLERMAKALDLSQQQIAQIKGILTTARGRAETVKANTSIPVRQQRADLKQIHLQAMQQINALLTPAQQQKWAEIRARQRAARQNKGVPAPTPPAPTE